MANGSDDGHQFSGFAAVGDGNEDIFFGNDAQIAVQALNRMHKESRCARAGERCYNFTSDQTGFADAGDDHPSLGFAYQVNGLRKVTIHSIH